MMYDEALLFCRREAAFVFSGTDESDRKSQKAPEFNPFFILSLLIPSSWENFLPGLA